MNIDTLRFGEVRVNGRLALRSVYGPDTDLGFVSDVEVIGDHRGYGQLTIKVGRPTVVPVGMVFYFGEGQDRAVRRPVFVDGIAQIDVVCVEPAQGGQWRHGKVQEKSMLPPSLIAGMLPGGGYSDLWRSMEFRAAYNGKGSAHTSLKELLEGRKDEALELDDEARGVLVMLDGRPIAVEVAPSRQGFQDWWMRCDYGSMFTYEAATLRGLPLPIGDPDDAEFPFEAGMAYIEWGPFKGWSFRDEDGYVCYLSLKDEEALRAFVPGHRHRPQAEWGEQPQGTRSL